MINDQEEPVIDNYEIIGNSFDIAVAVTNMEEIANSDGEEDLLEEIENAFNVFEDIEPENVGIEAANEPGGILAQNDNGLLMDDDLISEKGDGDVEEDNFFIGSSGEESFSDSEAEGNENDGNKGVEENQPKDDVLDILKEIKVETMSTDDDATDFEEESGSVSIHSLGSSCGNETTEPSVSVETPTTSAQLEDSEDDGNGLLNVMAIKQKYAPKTKVILLNTPNGSESGYRHEVVWPVDSIEVDLLPIETPAKSYKFVLDPFQHAAVVCIDNYQSVLISAHTSAGKTVAAEYAIAKALKDNQRVIYTTPIKALSNQKYREFFQEFGDVGIITGDVSINPSASCLVMTTEILRQMLYRGSEVTREVGWVIFDEIHYMKDKGRGVIWEETIILLPQKAHFVFLSATIPNATQFSEWIAAMHNQPCNVIHTDFRPIPLCHYIYPNGGEQVVQVVRGGAQTTNVEFNDDGFKTAMTVLENVDNANDEDEESHVIRLVTKLISEKMTPIIVFSFSRKECEAYALDMSKLDFNNDEEKGLISEVFLNAVDILSSDDQSLPQVLNLLPLLKRGIGIHHSGLLPIMKETIEILFSEGLIKILFATETFAMGLNMPAHTVVFTSIKKFDGKEKRLITAGEYIQMSGRAGRRNYDKHGTSIVMMDEVISLEEAKNLIMGRPDPIDSSFRLTYNMILNLIRGHDRTPEYMMSKSFLEFQHRYMAPEVCDRIIKASQECDKYTGIRREGEICSYYMLRRDLELQKKELKAMAYSLEHSGPFLQAGRLAHVVSGERKFGWGVIISYHLQNNGDSRRKKYSLHILLRVASDGAQSKTTSDLRPFESGSDEGSAVIVPVSINVVEYLSSIRLNCPVDLRSESSRIALLQIMDGAISDFQGKIPLLDPVKDMQIRDLKFNELVNSIKANEKKLFSHSLHQNEELPPLYALYHKKVVAYDKFAEELQGLKKYKALLNGDELKKRKRVLKRLDYLSSDDLIQLKGRVACELTGCDELLLTELLFCGVFLALDVPSCVALLSCFVCTEKGGEIVPANDSLKRSFELLQKTAKVIALLSQDCNLDVDPKVYVESFKPVLMNVVYQWCKGSTFAKLFEITDIYEGTIIRCMTALNEILNQMLQAAKVMENKELESKFAAGIKLIKRDIVFAASLYL